MRTLPVFRPVSGCSATWRGLCSLLAATAFATAAPFQVHSPGDLRVDYTVLWSDFSNVHETVVPDWQAFPVAGQGNVLVFGSSAADMTIWNSGGLFTSGVLLNNPGPEALHIYPPHPIQGFGITIEHRDSVQATYRMSFWTGSAEYLGEISVLSPGSAGNPAFLGVVDPEARIGILTISATPGSNFVLTDPLFQVAPVAETDPANLPIAGQFTKRVSGNVTYLHEGLDIVEATPETTTATLDNANACDLLEEFPALRGGDIIHFERIGISGSGASINHLLGLFSKTEVIKDGTRFRRVPGALDAGIDFRTATITSNGIETPTNLGSDFIIGQSSFVEVPADTAFAMFSLARPNSSGSVQVRVSHIQRLPFLEWVASFGLHGSLADLQSDLDGDGLTLIEEYAYRKDPTVNDANRRENYSFAPLINPDSAPGPPLSLLFGARSAAPLRYLAEFSSDLEIWEPAPDGSLNAILVDPFDPTRSVFGVTDPAGGPRRFGRISVEYIAPNSQ